MIIVPTDNIYESCWRIRMSSIGTMDGNTQRDDGGIIQNTHSKTHGEKTADTWTITINNQTGSGEYLFMLTDHSVRHLISTWTKIWCCMPSLPIYLPCNEKSGQNCATPKTIAIILRFRSSISSIRNQIVIGENVNPVIKPVWWRLKHRKLLFQS